MAGIARIVVGYLRRQPSKLREHSRNTNQAEIWKTASLISFSQSGEQLLVFSVSRAKGRYRRPHR